MEDAAEIRNRIMMLSSILFAYCFDIDIYYAIKNFKKVKMKMTA